MALGMMNAVFSRVTSTTSDIGISIYINSSMDDTFSDYISCTGDYYLAHKETDNYNVQVDIERQIS